MNIQYCDVSGYAVVVAPRLHDSTRVTLHHWRHVVGAWEPTEEEILFKWDIKPCPTIDEPDAARRGAWVSSDLAPVLDAVSIRVPRGTKVSICLTETAAALTDYPHDVLDECCRSYQDQQSRGVLFTRARLPGALNDIPASTDLAVYTVNPNNSLRIYDHSGPMPKLVHTSHIDGVLDISPPEADPTEDSATWLADLAKRDVNQVDPLDERVARWVDTYLAPAFAFTPSPGAPAVRRVQLFLPTHDLCANPHNTLNPLRERIVKRLQKIPQLQGVEVVLAGTTDAEPVLLLLDRLFTDCEKDLVNTDKYLITIEHDAETATVFVDHRTASSATVKFEKKVRLMGTYDESGELDAVLTKALGIIRDNDNDHDMTPFMVLFIPRTDSANPSDWFVQSRLKQWGSRGGVFLSCANSSASAGGGRLPLVQAVFRHAVVIDAGSTGTRAYVYSWRTNGPAEVVVVNPLNGPFAHPRLPFVKLVGSCNVGTAGIHELQAADIQAYLDPLFNNLNPLLAGVDRATTPLIALATGGMRTRDRNAIVANGTRATYTALHTAINNYITAKAAGENPFQSATFDVAPGDDEAMYGWITTNYALGRLEHAAPAAGGVLPVARATKGFLEMGGESLQVAYEGRSTYAGRHMAFAINYPGFNREFKVYTKEFNNLGAKAARRRYVAERIETLGAAFTFDRCWPRGNFIDPDDAVVGTGLRDAVGAADWVFVGQLGNSLGLLLPLWQSPFLEDGSPPVDPTIQFVGGANYWYFSRGLYPPGVAPAHSFSRAEMIELILAFARLPWATHAENVQNAADAKVGGMNDAQVNARVAGDADVAAKRITLIGNEVTENTVHKRALLFNALLGFGTLYVGVSIPGIARFQPYDGVIGLNAANPAANVPYSWTLGRALIHAIDGDVPVPVAAA